MSKKNKTLTTFDRSATIFMAIVCAISLLAVTGWLFNKPILASLSPEYIPMAPITALLFLGLCVTWFIQRIFPAKGWLKILIQACLLGMMIIVLMLTLRYFTGLGPDLEKLLYPDPALFGKFLTARMSPLTALGFFLAIPACYILFGGKPGKAIKTATSLSLVVLILSGLNSFGYLYAAPPFYGGTLIPVPITTALSFLFLSMAMLMTAGPACWPIRTFVGPSLKAHLIRAFIPATIFIAMLQGFLSTATAPLIGNPAIRVAVSALVAVLTVIIIISLLSNNLSAEFERGRQAEEALQQSEAELRALFASMHDIVLVIDRDGVYRKIAPTNPEMLVKPPEDLLGKRLLDVFAPGQADTFLRVMREVLDTKQTKQIEYDLIIDKIAIPFETTISPMTEDSTLWVARNITERKRMELEILNLSLTDELTGLYNRRGFTILAEQEMKLAHRIKRSMLLFFGDVDDLKTINDTLGHTHGDLALKEVGAILRETFREADIPARIGGDEFVILAVDASRENAIIITNRIQSALEARNQQGVQPYQLTLSLGVAHYDPESPSTVSELIAQADGIMYDQKHARKGKE